MNAQDASSDLKAPKFPYAWSLADGYPAKGIKSHKSKVFSFFSCGGGSSMGYKLAGYDVLGCCEIDPKIIAIYKKNHKPRHAYNMDIRDFNKIPSKELPDELFDLDILDGSPPCSVFSMSVGGDRSQVWDKEKKFTEGQKKQRLDDLFFHFIESAKILKPKFIISENVSGLLRGHAKGYVVEIVKEFKKIGYDTQIFLLNGATMGLPQKRQRVFFLCKRTSYDLGKIKLDFDYPMIPFSEIRDDSAGGSPMSALQRVLWDNRKRSDKTLADATMRLENRVGNFNRILVHNNQPLNTFTSHVKDHFVLYDMDRRINLKEMLLGSSFPLDYDFNNGNPSFLTGMSVPPVMTANIADQVYEQWLSKI